MKSQKAQNIKERKSPAVAVNQGSTTAQRQAPAHHARPSFDDLHARITTRAYELYVQRGYREGGSQEDWLDAEREIVSGDFPV